MYITSLERRMVLLRQDVSSYLDKTYHLTLTRRIIFRRQFKDTTHGRRVCEDLREGMRGYEIELAKMLYMKWIICIFRSTK